MVRVSNGEACMSNSADKQRREVISTRVDPAAREVIERLAAQRHTTPAQVVRKWIEGMARAFSENDAAA
jgi:hypothetical protein